MDEAHALMLFKEKLGMQGDSKNIAELVAALEFMPLAIVQAAAYISQRAPRCSVQQYLEEFQKSDRKKTSLLNHEGGHLRRDWEAKNSILITWQISFDHIRQMRPSAADLLSLMSFFDRQGIPEILVRDRTKMGHNYENQGDGRDSDKKDDDEKSVSESSGDGEFEDDVLTLRNYLFISANVDKITFEMHGLVQLATRKWLKAHGQLERWKQQFIKALCAEFPTGEYENWEKCQTLFPHAKSAAAQQPDEDSLLEWASLLYNAAWYALRRGNIAEAEKMSVKAMKTTKKALGQEHEKTLLSMAMVGLAYNHASRWKEAEELFMQVIKMSKKVLGEKHPSTLIYMSSLASTYSNEGRLKEAEKLKIQVMEVQKRVLGVDHPDTLTNMANLASTYRSQGRWKDAEKLLIQVIEAQKSTLGAKHPSTLASIGNLASTFWNQGRWKDAEKLLIQVMETFKRVLGAEHQDTLTSMVNLALTYSNQGRWKEAEELEMQVMEIQKRVLGAEHPAILTSIANLASMYSSQGRWKEAEELLIQVIKIRKRVLGVEHLDTLTSMANLAMTCGVQG
jgi:tetratricopeptide (TPR) repeat protein